jgi:hypothetical protein
MSALIFKDEIVFMTEARLAIRPITGETIDMGVIFF